jgi:hypothetical protein
MKTKTAVGTKKQSVTVKDLKTMKNPKGGYVDGNPSGASALPIKDAVARVKMASGIPHGQ